MNSDTVLPRPIFIIGAPRSGTSVTTWALGQHPNIQPMPETAWIANMAISVYRAWLKGSERGRFSHLSNVEYPVEPFMARMGEGVHCTVCDVFEERCRLFYGDWRSKGAIRWNPENPKAATQLRRHVDDPKSRWIDGTPMNTSYTWGLRLLFPEARFIHLLRRPEDVAVSLMNFEQLGAVSQSPKIGLRTWMDHTHFAMLTQRAFGTKAVVTVQYTDLISDTDTTLRHILHFLDEAPSSDCLLPFGKKINSSNVDEKRTELVTMVKREKTFAAANALYDRSLETDVSEQDCELALEEIKTFFLSMCDSAVQ